MKKQVRLHSDYADWPLWDDGGATGPEEWLMLSAGLLEALQAFQDYWELNFNHERGWIDGTAQWYEDESQRLAERLAAELGESCEVVVLPQ